MSKQVLLYSPTQHITVPLERHNHAKEGLLRTLNLSHTRPFANMMVGKITALALTALATQPVAAQTESPTLQPDSALYYKALNGLENMYAGTDNPVALTYNRVQSVADAQAFARLTNGRFHDVDEGRKTQDFGASIYGLQRFGNLSLSGSFEYLNAQSFDTRWNNTLYVAETNPFVLADAIASDARTESFDLSAAASYRLGSRLTTALSLRYLTGSRSDQTDPRPKTNAMHFVIRPGMEFRFSPVHSLGISGGIDLFRSDLSHAVVNNNQNYIYYVMKGMGDFVTRTSSDIGSYPRDYKGNRWQGSLQYVLTPSKGRVRNLVELSYTHNKEVAEDGGYAFTYKSGDYYRTDLSLYDRLSLRHSERFEQNFTVRLGYGTDSGDWYDQKKVVDTDHGNAVNYVVLNQSTISEGRYLTAGADYQADLLREGLPNLSFSLGAAFAHSETDQYYTRTFRQSYQTLRLHLGAVKHWRLGHLRLASEVGAAYQMLLGDATYDAIVMKNNDISQSYVAPAFEYATASHADLCAQADLALPVTLYQHRTWLGLKVRAASSFYLGDNRYADHLDGSTRTRVDAAFYVTF